MVQVWLLNPQGHGPPKIAQNVYFVALWPIHEKLVVHCIPCYTKCFSIVVRCLSADTFAPHDSTYDYYRCLGCAGRSVIKLVQRHVRVLGRYQVQSIPRRTHVPPLTDASVNAHTVRWSTDGGLSYIMVDTYLLNTIIQSY